MCVFVGDLLDVCLRQTLCGHRECEKLGVLTAFEPFQNSAGQGASGPVGCSGEL